MVRPSARAPRRPQPHRFPARPPDMPARAAAPTTDPGRTRPIESLTRGDRACRARRMRPPDGRKAARVRRAPDPGAAPTPGLLIGSMQMDGAWPLKQFLTRSRLLPPANTDLYTVEEPRVVASRHVTSRRPPPAKPSTVAAQGAAAREARPKLRCSVTRAPMSTPTGRIRVPEAGPSSSTSPAPTSSGRFQRGGTQAQVGARSCRRHRRWPSRRPPPASARSVQHLADAGAARPARRGSSNRILFQSRSSIRLGRRRAPCRPAGVALLFCDLDGSSRSTTATGMRPATSSLDRRR